MRDRNLIEANTLCSVGEVALTLNLTIRRIRQLQALGILPKSVSRGKYSLIACSNAYTAYQRKELRSLRARGKKQRKNKKLSPTELEAWRNRVDSELKQFSERLMQLRKQNDTSLDIELDMSEFQKKKGGTKHDRVNSTKQKMLFSVQCRASRI
jgi:DNA-binding transcriptional MerR regulator